ncbi:MULTISPECIES: molybdopterin-guanine dinucleotide biosynthesis protein MobB [unclassified Brenneria]|uniref:molybdopterin-guanine dinucleotide biosynthesis protein MobB n=1 Tax=unclassified Brenneria TaxID=2634434 RepID=UPI0029C2C5C9|nr:MULTISPECIES: molybdopterin-guanine dinucleotide biosynthesis protein MobB [unclassified Brenneria]MDX5629893.1 molybdopterin-guanine dinucleotide biosynthesis protein MobB [Brenneria sp. L3-3Z]MDX5697039.1 molybdopterin-guanine dinucleotide biosynthesis protein MobB [Brenneria sp. L4-2C]MEE3664371.1 molybdopterin-guanine dinucleotide biosynthesis protein MobB [Brenneria sp. g21c3]
MKPDQPQLLAIAAYSGTGKTTLLKALIPILRRDGIRIGLIKHTHHNMDIDTPGKDSYELRKAGAEQTMVVSNQRWALMTETPAQQQPDLHELAQRMESAALDLILVEGFKQEKISKIVLFRQALGRPLSDLLDEYAIAVATDSPLATSLTQLDINQPQQVADFIRRWLSLTP